MTLTYEQARYLVPCPVKVRYRCGNHGIPARLIEATPKGAVVLLRNHGKLETIPWNQVWLWKSRMGGR